MPGESAVAGVRSELESIPEGVAPGLVALALAMAAEVDDSGNSATSKSMCAARCQDALRELRELAPPKEEETDLDRRRREREQRIAGLSTSGSAASS